MKITATADTANNLNSKLFTYLLAFPYCYSSKMYYPLKNRERLRDIEYCKCSDCAETKTKTSFIFEKIRNNCEKSEEEIRRIK